MNLPSLPTIFPVTCHTDFVGHGSTFVAICGYADNGINYIKHAIEKGARTIIVHCDAVLDNDLLHFIQMHNAVVQRVDDTRKALAQLSAQAAGFPAIAQTTLAPRQNPTENFLERGPHSACNREWGYKKLKIIGITGTKGKTTTSFLLEHILAQAGYKTALISSAQNKINGTKFASSLTTPQPDYLHQFLKLCVESDIEYVVMEVAAQALTLHRVEGIVFCGVIFTNFSHEHLEFYPNLQEYFDAKKLIFNQIMPDAPLLVNRDNAYCATIAVENRKITSFGFNNTDYDYYAHATTQSIMHNVVCITYDSSAYTFACPALFGAYNAYNIVAATSMALSLGIRAADINKSLATFAGVPGRLQEHSLPNGARCFIDYAHNPESFQAVLSTLRALTPHLIVVFGAGGGRDKSKRPMMGHIASQIADLIIVTSDNPRLEDPAVIANDIIQGIAESSAHKIIQELDRAKAIEYAYQLSDCNSIIALLGKGPDEYQIIGTNKHYFSERAIVEGL